MPETGSPPEDEQQNTRSVSPLTFFPVSRCSTPGISSLDGSPRYLFVSAPSPPPRPRSASPLGMAVKLRRSTIGHQERRTEVRSVPNQEIEQQEPSAGLPDPTIPSEDVPSSDGPATLPSLDALTYLHRLEKYQARKCKQIQHELHQSQIAGARASRLAHTARLVQRTLAECIRSEDKHSFVSLSNALHDALDGIDATSPGDQTKETENVRNVDYPNSFLDALPTESRVVMLDFLSKVRHDGDFVADRLSALTHKELVSLLPEKVRSTDSIFGSSPRTSSRTSKHLGFVADGQTELLSSLEYGSPLETLILSTRGISQTSLVSDSTATDLWSTICARLILEQKPGFERFVPAVINVWAMSSPWPGAERLGMWISQVLQDGIFLLELPNKQTFRLRAQGLVESNADNEASIGQYFASCVNSLVSLLCNPASPGVIPDGAVNLCRAIFRKLHPSQQHQQAFPNFVLTRWLVSSFLPDAITLPEMHGLMTDYYFTENTRKQVLREIAGRTHKAVFDFVYAWKSGTAVSDEIADLVRTIADQFRPSPSQDQAPSLGDSSRASASQDSPDFISVCSADVTTIVSTLYPRRRLESISSELEHLNGGLQSSASSISGLSLFQNSGSSEAIYRITTPWAHELQQPVAFEPVITSAPENGYPSRRVDSFLQPEWDHDQLWDAVVGIEEFVSNESSPGTGSWCILLGRAAGQSLCTFKGALLDVPDVDTIDHRSLIHLPSEFASLQNYRDDIEELLSCGDLPEASEVIEDNIPGLVRLTHAFQAAFDKRISDIEQNSDFVGAHSWCCKRRNFNRLVAEENGQRRLYSMLNEIKLDKEKSLSWSQRIMDSCATWIRSLHRSFEVYGKEVLHRSDIVHRLRDKMWYVAEVRPSAAYEEVRLIASALKVMGKPKQPPRTRLAPPLRHWSGPRISSGGLQAKTEAQTLDILGTPSDYGGPNKLSDDQSKTLHLWMERNTVENLCAGEERIHKLCMEILKAVDQITVESSPLLSSSLFARENATTLSERTSRLNSPLWPLQAGTNRFNLLTLQTNVAPSIDSLSSASSHPLSARSSRDNLETRSPAMTNRSSAPFWSPVMTEARSPSSATSIGSSQTHAAGGHRVRQQNNTSMKTSNHDLLERLRQRIYGLLLSELAATTFGKGSETDCAFWTGLGGDLSIKHLSSLHQNFAVSTDESSFDDYFDFNQAFRVLIRRFEVTPNPSTKLEILQYIDTLLTPFMAEQDFTGISGTESKLNSLALQKLKRQGGSQSNLKIEGFRRLLCGSSTRPVAIFRDLQYIAALVPSRILETTPQGKAFWNIAVAASSLKQEIRQLMVETADGIISYHSNNRGHRRAASTAQQERDSATFSVPSRTPSAEDIKRYTMADAAYLLQITAKEGDPAAQRELATLYLTHPELMDHIIAPFSRPRDVFKEELENKWRKNQDTNRCDPMTMCVAHHWMSLSSKGGDALAKEYLRQREEMDRIG